jgi:hypothetical protein
MLSNGFDAPLRLKLSPSRLFVYFQLFVHGIALFGIMLPSALSLMSKAGLALFIVIHFIRLLRDYYRQSKQNELTVVIKGNHWFLYEKELESVWTCEAVTLTTAWFLLVKLTNDVGHRSLLVSKDQCDMQTFRRLKVKLKFFQGDAAIPTDAS